MGFSPKGQSMDCLIEPMSKISLHEILSPSTCRRYFTRGHHLPASSQTRQQPSDVFTVVAFRRYKRHRSLNKNASMQPEGREVSVLLLLPTFQLKKLVSNTSSETGFVRGAPSDLPCPRPTRVWCTVQNKYLVFWRLRAETRRESAAE